MRLGFFGGFAAWDAAGSPIDVPGRGQRALLFRLALDAGTTVGYRALAEDVWPADPPEDPRAALQSLASRLRRALPAGTLLADAGGYRLAVARDDVDIDAFADLVAAAREAPSPDAAALARRALTLWRGDPWTPEGFDWVVRDLWEDRAHAERLRAAALTGGSAAGEAAPPPAAVPALLTPLVGRGDEIALIGEQLADNRLVTILGPGGAGKTTLALDAARRHPGAVVAELAPAAAGEVWSALAGAVGRTMRVTESMLRLDPRERALEGLSGRDVVVVFDNCEHVVQEAAAVALAILRAAPGARVLATSREPLGVPGEAFVPLGPLPEPDAVELFTRRVRAARGSAPAEADAHAVSRIVRRLDGLPLALELAAAKTRLLSIPEIEAGLDDRFALLASGPRSADPRHQTLRALIDWSWETLTDPERVALCGAAVLPDGFLASDAGGFAAPFGTEPAAFEALVDRSLLRRSDGRYRMLETVREYGLDVLRRTGSEGRVRREAAQALAGLAAAHDPLLRGPQVREGLAWFDANEENLTSALRTAEDEGDRRLGIELLRATLWAWAMRERFVELSGALRAFAAPDLPLDSEPAVVVAGLAVIIDVFGQAQRGEPDPAAVAGEEHQRRAAEIAEAASSYPSELSLVFPSLLRAMAAAMADPDPRPSRMWGFDISRVTTPEDAPLWTRAFLAVMRTAFAQNAGDIEALGRESQLALALFSELGDVWGTALATQMRGEWLMLDGRLEEALAVIDESADALLGLTSTSDVIQQRATAVGILTRLGRFAEARQRLVRMDAAAAADGSDRALLQAALAGAAVEIAAGDGAAALARLDSGPDGDAGGPIDQLAAWSGSTRAQALLLLDRVPEAADVLRVTMPMALRTGDQPIVSIAALTLAAWFDAAGRPDEARRALAHAVRLRGRADETDPIFRRLVETLGPVRETTEGDEDLEALVALLG